MTLVEVMVGFLVLALTVLSALSGIMFAWRVSDSNLRAVTALEIARSVSEQIITLDFETLQLTTLPVDLPSSPSGSMTVGIWNNRSEDIHDTPANTADDLIVGVWPEIEVTEDSSGARCARVVVRIFWEENSFFTRRTREDAVTIVRSPVAAY
jgi:hypothetical protein